MSPGVPSGGKSSTTDARYRYVLQLSVIGPEGTLFPLMHEEMDLHNPETQKEDCELKSFQRLSQRLKKEFPKLPRAFGWQLEKAHRDGGKEIARQESAKMLV